MTSEAPGQSFRFVGGSLCLDFVNTVGGRAPSATARSRGVRDQVVRDKLTGYPDLVDWSQAAGVLSGRAAERLLRLATRRPREAAAVYARCLVLREACYRLVRVAQQGGEPPRGDLQTLDREARAARAREHIVAVPRGFVWGGPAPRSLLDGPLASVASSAAELLTSAELGQVRRCGGENCGWLFLDTSRNRRRQWCDMRDCGNRAKVRRFRERHKAD